MTRILTFFAVHIFRNGIALELVRQSALAGSARLREDRGLRFVSQHVPAKHVQSRVLTAQTYIDGDDVRHCRKRGQSSAYLLENAGTFHRIGLSQTVSSSCSNSLLSPPFRLRTRDCIEALHVPSQQGETPSRRERCSATCPRGRQSLEIRRIWICPPWELRGALETRFLDRLRHALGLLWAERWEIP